MINFDGKIGLISEDPIEEIVERSVTWIHRLDKFVRQCRDAVGIVLLDPDEVEDVACSESFDALGISDYRREHSGQVVMVGGFLGREVM